MNSKIIINVIVWFSCDERFNDFIKDDKRCDSFNNEKLRELKRKCEKFYKLNRKCEKLCNFNEVCEKFWILIKCWKLNLHLIDTFISCFLILILQVDLHVLKLRVLLFVFQWFLHLLCKYENLEHYKKLRISLFENLSQRKIAFDENCERFLIHIINKNLYKRYSWDLLRHEFNKC